MVSTATDLTVTVKLFATLRRLAPPGVDPRGFEMTLPTGTTIRALAERLRLPEAEWKLAFVNHVQRRDRESALQHGDVVAFFPPIAGG